MLILINLGFTILFLGGAFYFWRKSSQIKQAISEPEIDKASTLVSISVPKNNDRTPLAAEQMFAALHGIFRSSSGIQTSVSCEVVTRNKNITFYIYMPSDLKDFVLSQVYAQYPTVDIKEISLEEDYSRIGEGKEIAATELSLKRSTVYPIKTFQNFEVDPLSAITGVLSSASEQEEIWVQMIVRPVDDDWQEQGEKEIKNIKKPPAKTEGVVKMVTNEASALGMEFLRSLVTGTGAVEQKKEDKKDDKAELTGTQQQAMKGIEEKITKLGFETTIRLVTAAPDQFAAQAKLEQVVGAYKQYNTINLNSFISKAFVTDRAVLELYRARAIGEPEMIFNITELASLYHFPSETVATPTITWAGAKKGEPPANLPTVSTVPADELTVLGQTNFRNEAIKFGIKKKDRRLHSYLIGKTGTGKSTLLENMIYDDIKEGRGVAVVDPHGQLIEHVLQFIPEDRIKDVIYFNPADHDWPIGFNPLENKDLDPEKRVILSSGVVGVFKKIFGESWGPRMEYILRNAILGLLDYPNATLLGVMRVLSDNAFRRLVVSEIKDPTIKAFFVDEYEKYDPKFRQEAINPIQNKVGQFLSSSIIRNIVGQPSSTFRLDEVMNNGKILLADLSIGKMGEDNSALLGSMLITQIQLAAMGRTNIPEDERRDFYLYVDEFQNFATDSFATILSEARKYRLSLVMAHQYIAQMPETVSNAVFGNIGTMISFRVGAGDANALKEEFSPVFDENDLVNLANYQVYLKMAIDGVTVPAFSASTLTPPSEIYQNVEKVIEMSRQQYGRPRADVEEQIVDWSLPINLNQGGESERGEFGHPAARPLASEKIVTPKSEPAPELPATKVVEEGSQPSEIKPPDLPKDISPVEEKDVLAEPQSFLSTKGSKIEMLTDRFNRRWYAVTPEKNEGGGVAEKNQPDITPLAAEMLAEPEESTAPMGSENRQTEPQSREVGETRDENDQLITWEKADELGLKLTDEPLKPTPKSDGFEPIDEL